MLDILGILKSGFNLGIHQMCINGIINELRVPSAPPRRSYSVVAMGLSPFVSGLDDKAFTAAAQMPQMPNLRTCWKV
jgi:hypothetical protein